MNELLPCPFCGCTKIPVQKCNGIGDTWLKCTECGSGTRLREDIQSCVKDWNRRAPSASAEHDVAVRTQTFKDCIDAIRGAIAFGQQDAKHPPTGHWLAEFWDIGAKLRTYDQRIVDLGVLAMESAPPAAHQAARDVLAERRRQIEAEGWTPEHDDEHSTGEMAVAAACYMLADTVNYPPVECPDMWPWAPEWWKPRGDRRNLVRAGALIIAEIERLDRAAADDGGAS